MRVLNKDKTMAGTVCSDMNPPKLLPLEPCTLPPSTAPIPKEANRLEAKRLRVMTMNLTRAVRNLQRLMYVKELCKLERIT